MFNIPRTQLFVAGAAAIAVPLAAAAASLPQDSNDQLTFDKKAGELLRQVYQSTMSAGAASVNIDMKLQFNMAGMNEEQEGTFALAVAQPNLLRISTDDPSGSMKLISNGDKVFYEMSGLNAYSTAEAPDDLASLLSVDSDVMQQLGVFDLGPAALMTFAVCETDLNELLERGSKGEIGAELLGRETVNDKPMHHLRLTLTAEDFGETAPPDGETIHVPVEFWIAAEGRALIQRMKPDLSPMMEAMAGDMPGAEAPTVNMELKLKDWTLGDSVDRGLFTYTPPDDATMYESMDEAFDAMMAGGGPDPNELLGTDAPAFSAELLDGASVDIADHRGKDIVVLDFWATWCPPCVKGLPLVAKATQKFENQNVVFYAVNQAEGDEKVRSFLENAKLGDINVLMDRRSTIASQFKVSGIPQTVIIGKDGTVQAVHVGFATGMEKQLEEELKTLLKGESLVEKKE